MKKLMNYIVAGGMLVAVAAPLQAEQASSDRITRLVTSESVTGSLLWDYHGNQLGRITDVMLQPFHNQIFVVVDTDGLLEADHKVIVPWKKIYVKAKDGDADEVIYTLDADKQKMTDAPVWDKDSAINFGDRVKVMPVYKFWDLEIEIDRKQAARE